MNENKKCPNIYCPWRINNKCLAYTFVSEISKCESRNKYIKDNCPTEEEYAVRILLKSRKAMFTMIRCPKCNKKWGNCLLVSTWIRCKKCGYVWKQKKINGKIV